MSFIDTLQNALDRMLPRRSKTSAVPAAVGIGNGLGMVNYEDDVSISSLFCSQAAAATVPAFSVTLSLYPLYALLLRLQPFT
jgi:hypothetical protein